MAATLLTARRVLAYTECNGGGTFWPWGEPVTHIKAGYLVGGAVRGVRLAWDKGESLAALERKVRDFLTVAIPVIQRTPQTYLGTWIDDDGWLYLDVAQWEPTLVGAIALGIARHEKAVYDCRAHVAQACPTLTAPGREALENVYN